MSEYLRKVVAEVERLRTIVDKLSEPNFYWDDRCLETASGDLAEAVQGDDAGDIVVLRPMHELPTIYVLVAEHDCDHRTFGSEDAAKTALGRTPNCANQKEGVMCENGGPDACAACLDEAEKICADCGMCPTCAEGSVDEGEGFCPSCVGDVLAKVRAEAKRLRALDAILHKSQIYIRQPCNPLRLGSLPEDYGEVTIRCEAVEASMQLIGLLYPPALLYSPAPTKSNRARSGV